MANFRRRCPLSEAVQGKRHGRSQAKLGQNSKRSPPDSPGRNFSQNCVWVQAPTGSEILHPSTRKWPFLAGIWEVVATETRSQKPTLPFGLGRAGLGPRQGKRGGGLGPCAGGASTSCGPSERRGRGWWPVLAHSLLHMRSPLCGHPGRPWGRGLGGGTWAPGWDTGWAPFVFPKRD